MLVALGHPRRKCILLIYQDPINMYHKIYNIGRCVDPWNLVPLGIEPRFGGI